MLTVRSFRLGNLELQLCAQARPGSRVLSTSTLETVIEEYESFLPSRMQISEKADADHAQFSDFVEKLTDSGKNIRNIFENRKTRRDFLVITTV